MADYARTSLIYGCPLINYCRLDTLVDYKLFLLLNRCSCYARFFKKFVFPLIFQEFIRTQSVHFKFFVIPISGRQKKKHDKRIICKLKNSHVRLLKFRAYFNQQVRMT